jgi:hypothetical protein
LAAGQFYVDQVVAQEFRGVFTGTTLPPAVARLNQTVIDVPGQKTVPVYQDPDWKPPDPEIGWTPCGSPSGWQDPQTPEGSAAMIVFEGGGNIKVRNMTLKVSQQDAAMLHRPIHLDNDSQYVVDYMLLVARRPDEDMERNGDLVPAALSDEGVSVENVRFLVEADSKVRVGLGFSGAFVTLNDCEEPDTCTNRDPCTNDCTSDATNMDAPCRGRVTAMPFTGTHSVTNSTFDGPSVGVEAMGWKNGTLTVGGSAAEGNQFVWGDHGVAIIDHDNSSFEISHNVVNSRRVGIRVEQRSGQPRQHDDRDALAGEPFFRPPSDTQEARVSHNTVSAGTVGIQIKDSGHRVGQDLDGWTPGAIYGNQRAVVEHNVINMSHGATFGIYDMGERDSIRRNTISSEGSMEGAGIWELRANSCSVFLNNVENVSTHGEWNGNQWKPITLNLSEDCTVVAVSTNGSQDVADWGGAPNPNNITYCTMGIAGFLEC